ncbi:MAG: hypothetical protein PVF87_00310 [Acidimicrobiia bacterium]
MRKTLVGLVVAALMAVSLTAFAGVGGPAFYVDEVLYRTVGTPTDFTNTGAPDHTFDTIYQFFDLQEYNVATAAPGDNGYNGGRWRVEVIQGDYDSALAAFDANSSGDFDSADEVHAALDDGILTTTPGPSFECPVIPLPRGRN